MPIYKVVNECGEAEWIEADNVQETLEEDGYRWLRFTRKSIGEIAVYRKFSNFVIIGSRKMEDE